MKKTAYIGLFIIILMFGSTFAYAIIQGGWNSGEVSLPETNVINYELSLSQKYTALMKGMIILNYKYSQACENCLENKDYLEQLAYDSQFGGQMFVEEILVNDTGELPILNMTGFKISENRIELDYREFQGENVTQNSTFDAVCELMIDPPIDCTLKKV